MIKKSFFGLAKPRIEYDDIGRVSDPIVVPIPKKVTLLAKKQPEGNNSILLTVGDKVKTGQKLTVYSDNNEYIIATVTGKIASILPYSGDMGKQYSAVTIQAEGDEEIDDEFTGTPSTASISEYLACIPGTLPKNLFSDSGQSIKIIAVTGMDPDMSVSSWQYIIRYNITAVKKGVDILKKVTGIDNVVMVVPPSLMQDASLTKIEVKTVDAAYPSANPRLIAKNVLNVEIPAGKTCEDMGIYFVNAETAASIGNAFAEKKLPVRKTLTVIKKDGTKKMASAVIGTPIGDILSAAGITLNAEDRIINGGLMTGAAIYSTDQPVLPDMDAIIVQDSVDVAPVSDNACINCGECIRICPAKIQVNLLVRFLEAGQYEEAANNYDLFSCIDCGLCSYVCTAKMPVFQYIRLAKFEYARIQAEAAQAEAEAEAQVQAEAGEAENA